MVLASALVSRKHAELGVTRATATLSDLGSSNGVYVNGERVTAPVALRNGDRIMVGDQDLEVVLGAASGPVPIDRSQLAALRTLEIRTDDDDDDLPHSSERSAPGTRQVDFFELVGRVVDRVLSAGRFDEAATMLQAQMNRMLSDARSGRVIPPAHRDASLRYAALLASGTRDARFVDYALDLLGACACTLPEDLAADLAEAVGKVGKIDEQRLARYAAAVDGLPEPLERLRGGTLVRELQRAARRGR